MSVPIPKIPTYETNGANIVLYKMQNGILKVLLQKGATRKTWELPGGGLQYDRHGSHPEGGGENFRQCVSRELREETGITISPGSCILEAQLQQRKRIEPLPDCFVIGMVMLYSLYFEADMADLTLQISEVSDVKYWDLQDALKATSGPDSSDQVVLLGHRRMLAIFFQRFVKRQRGTQTPHPFEADLSETVRLLSPFDGNLLSI